MQWSLFDNRGRRKYLVPLERRAFLGAALRVGGPTATLCAVLVFTGARISEALALTAEMIDFGNDAINIHTLKQRNGKSGKRSGVVVRSVPVPRRLLAFLDQIHDCRVHQRSPAAARTHLWPWSRTTAWRRVKAVMLLSNVPAYVAMPKAVRHAFGAAATTKSITLTMIQKWLGHSDIRTTSIYTTVIGREERALAKRAWAGLDREL